MSRNLPACLLALFVFVLSFNLSAQNPAGDNRRCQENARISLAFSGDTVRNTCVDDDVMDRLRFQVQPFRQAFAYVVVDANDIIQFIDFTNFINFDMLPAGQLRVYAFSNYGNILAEVGDTFTGATLSLPCAGLTSNFVTINNGAIGDVEIESAQDAYDFCVGDGNADIITVSSGATDAVYLVTDANGVVLSINESGTIDFEPAPGGDCRVYALAGGLAIAEGDNVSILDGQGTCGTGLSTNFITISRTEVRGGVITTDDGAVNVEICPGDGNPDLVTFTQSNTVGTGASILITDENNVIVMIPDGNTVDFDATPLGVCRAWGIVYSEDELVAEVGQSANDVLAQNDCVALSSNFVLVTRTAPEGGSLATTDGQTEVQTCPGDGVDDIIEVAASGASGGELVYILTEEDNTIISFSTEPSFNLEDAPVGTCRIWSATYRGSLMFGPGEDVTATDISDNCFDLSNNFVTVVRAIPAGGTVATAAGETQITTCPGDGTDDFVTFVSSDASATNFTFIVTDSDNVILGVPDGNMVNFEGAGTGTCRLWGLSYEGDLLAAEGLDAAAAQLATECFSLSDNFVTVVRELPSAGTVSLSNGATQISVCPGDGIADELTFVSTGATGESFAFVVTDEDGEILGFPASATIDFESIDPGTCRVYGLSYSGTITGNIGDNINEDVIASSCAALSDNFVTVNRIEASTGIVFLEDGGFEALVCPGDAIPDVLRFDSMGTTLSNFNYLVTDTNNVVLQLPFTDAINFENFNAGVCRVWGLGYDGVVTATVGQVAGVDQLATQCSALSDTFVTVVKQIPDGGLVSTDAGENEVMLCPMDGVPDLITMQSTSASGARFFYVVTTEDNVVINIQDGPTFDFDPAPFGVCRIWGLSFQGTLLIGTGDDLDEVQIAEGCADLSDNFVTIIRQDAAVGSISLAGGGDVITTCPDDGNPDVVEFTVDGASGNVTYLITTEQDTLLTSTSANSFDFDGAGTGVCRVYAVSFDGFFSGEPGDEVTTANLATGCFALSENYVTVIRQVPSTSTVSLADGSTELTYCAGDSEPDVLRFLNDATFGSYGYIIADQGIALTAITTDSIDLSNAQTNMLEVYGVSYTGNLTVTPGLNIFESELSTDCYQLSDNFITLNITKVEGGEILGNGAEELYFCPDNLDDGMVTFTNNSILSAENYVYVITTANAAQVILSILDGDSFDFGALPLMEVKVFAVSYTGDFVAIPGTSLAFGQIATGCVGISENCVTVFNDSPEAGEVSVSGLSSTGVSCIVDGNTDITVTTTSTSATGYAVLVTDTAGIIQLVSETPGAVPFGTLPEGDYRLYGLAYTGNVSAMVGDDIAIAVLADNCYELTADFVEITRGGEITAGTLSNLTSEMGGDTITFCLGDPEPAIAIVQASIGTANYRYIVTDTDNRVLIANLPSNIIPFTSFMPGEYRIYGFNFTGMPNVGLNQVLTEAVLSTECYALSNFITVILEDPTAGFITTVSNETEVEVEIDNTSGTPVAVVGFALIPDGSISGELAYVITDEDNLVLNVSTDPNIDFGPAGAGVCRVWNLAYSGELLVPTGEDAATAQFSTECFDLSDNFVTVTRTEEDGFAGDNFPGGEIEQDGIESSSSLSAFPNPTQGDELFVTIQSNLPLAEGQITVRDLNGQTHQVQTVAGGSATETVRLDLTGLAPGMYFATYLTAGGIETLQFMRQ